DPPAHRLPSEVRVIRIDIKTEQRQPKPFLPRARSMARPRVAALLRQHRLHMVAKAPLEWLIDSADQNVRARRLTIDGCRDLRFSIANGHDLTIFNSRDALVARLKHQSLCH